MDGYEVSAMLIAVGVLAWAIASAIKENAKRQFWNECGLAVEGIAKGVVEWMKTVPKAQSNPFAPDLPKWCITCACGGEVRGNSNLEAELAARDKGWACDYDGMWKCPTCLRPGGSK